MTSPAFPIVGIGASAGGIEALEHFFRGMPEAPGLGFVILTHLRPQRESHLHEVVARYSNLPVRIAADGVQIAPNFIYVLPPDAILSIEGGRLVIQRQNAVRRERNPIDVFFSALAMDQGELAAGVVLSGSNSDGTLGIKAIKEQGGLTVAQGTDGTAPGHPGMPDSAIASGLVDMVMSVGDIPAKLAEYAASCGGLAALNVDPAERPRDDQARIDAARRAICDILRDETGHDFSGYKERSFLRRVQRRMQVLQSPSLDAYVNRLRGDHKQAMALLRDLLISVTDFFRDTAAFAALTEDVIPQLFAGKGEGDAVRVWVPGCSTGEEAYSVAILLAEHAVAGGDAPRLQVFATDIDEAALVIARAGCYPLAQLGGVSPERLDRFFTRDGVTRTVTKELRALCLFSNHSVIRDPPFSRIDLISCRNLLIYLDADTQRKLFPVFHFALRPRGFLLLGSAESAVQYADLFAPVDKLRRIYQRRDHANPKVRMPVGPALRGTGAGSGPASGNGAHKVREVAEATILDRFAPPHVVVTREGDVVYFSARTGAYLEAPSGQPTRSLPALARRALRPDLRIALAESLQSRRSVTRANIEIATEAERRRVSITVGPLAESDSDDPLFLVVFAEEPSSAASPPGAPTRPADDAAARLVEQELRETRERLQSLIEEHENAAAELRASNEELVSVNEELQSSNEELETSKEEQQSSNEELHTVNHQLLTKVDALDQAQRDLNNVFETTRVATVILDKDLLIRSFTPPAAQLFALRPGDQSRPLAELAGAIATEDVVRDARDVMRSGTPIERAVARRDGGGHYLMRVLPNHGPDGAITGVLTAFVDVTKLVEANEHQRVLVAELNHRVRNILTVVMGLTRLTLSDDKPLDDLSEALIGRMTALAKAYELIAEEDWRQVALADLVREQIAPHLALPEQVRIEGPPVMLDPAEGQAFSLVLHELATNAVKYGALSWPTGSLRISWEIEAEEREERRLVLRWIERGGPPAVAPDRIGFGTTLISNQVELGLHGTYEPLFGADGLSVTITTPLDAPVVKPAGGGQEPPSG